MGQKQSARFDAKSTQMHLPQQNYKKVFMINKSSKHLETSTDDYWIQIDHSDKNNWEFPKWIGQMVLINDNEFIVSTWNSYNLRIYNTMTNQWNPNKINLAVHNTSCHPSNSHQHTISIDSDNGILYIFCPHSKQIITINLANRSLAIYHLLIIKLGYTQIKHCKSCFVNNQLHIIGGYVCNTHTTSHRVNESKCVHFVYDVTRNELDAVHTFKGKGSKHGYYCFVYCKSQNRFLLFGDIGDGNDYIRSYSLTDKKWISLKSDRIKSVFSYTLTSDEKYIILFNTLQEIFILDITKTAIKSRQCAIKCPKKGGVYAVSVMYNESNILISGYIRMIFGHDNFIPDDIINLICIWYGKQYIYLVDAKDQDYHWKIPLSIILNAAC